MCILSSGNCLEISPHVSHRSAAAQFKKKLTDDRICTPCRVLPHNHNHGHANNQRTSIHSSSSSPTKQQQKRNVHACLQTGMGRGGKNRLRLVPLSRVRVCLCVGRMYTKHKNATAASPSNPACVALCHRVIVRSPPPPVRPSVRPSTSSTSACFALCESLARRECDVIMRRRRRRWHCIAVARHLTRTRAYSMRAYACMCDKCVWCVPTKLHTMATVSVLKVARPRV